MCEEVLKFVGVKKVVYTTGEDTMGEHRLWFNLKAQQNATIVDVTSGHVARKIKKKMEKNEKSINTRRNK